jgi:hypothetical protein
VKDRAEYVAWAERVGAARSMEPPDAEVEITHADGSVETHPPRPRRRSAGRIVRS